jgi:hypothetical protein
MLTTDGPTCSTKSVKSGRVRFCAQAEGAGVAASRAATHKDIAATLERNEFFRGANIIYLVFKWF